MTTLRVVIRGRVQGVGFRDALKAQAESLGVFGWVRNRADGSVEALVQGPSDAVAAIIAWARRGPPAARVADVQIKESEHEPTHQRFELRPTV